MFDIRGYQIACVTNNEKECVLRYIEENYPKARWNSGSKPTKFLGYNAPMSIFIGLDLKIWHTNDIEKHSRKFITAKDLIGDFTLPSKEHLMEFLED